MKFKALLLILTFLWNVNLVNADEGNKDISFYTGTFDLLDKEADVQTILFVVEHKNRDLFRPTFLGKFKPITGAFITGKSSVYLYTGIEGQYGIGPVSYTHLTLPTTPYV